MINTLEQIKLLLEGNIKVQGQSNTPYFVYRIFYKDNEFTGNSLALGEVKEEILNTKLVKASINMIIEELEHLPEFMQNLFLILLKKENKDNIILTSEYFNKKNKLGE